MGEPALPGDPVPSPSCPGADLGADPEAGSGFADETYLRLNPDVRLAVMAGKFRNGRDHYEHYGRAEGRPVTIPPNTVRDRLLITGGPACKSELSAPPGFAIDAIKISKSGGIFLVGWIDDVLDQLDCIMLHASGWYYCFNALSLARVARRDARDALGNVNDHAYGVWGFSFVARPLSAGVCNLILRLKSGREISFMATAELIADAQLRKAALAQIAQAEYPGNPYFDAVATIATSIGAQLVDFSKMLSRSAVNAPYVERFGQRKPHYRGSIIVCLYGRPEYLFLQAAMFARLAGIGDYEFIYVSNSPDLAETLLKEARLCAQIYGMDLSLVLLNDNAGFGAANNAAISYAASDRLIFMNPDVFPRNAEWARLHTGVLDGLPAAQSALFGAPLYYDNGSLMHAGMFFCADIAPIFLDGRVVVTRILRVEHYGKGAPPHKPSYLRSRPVPAVTGAFISASRGWFEQLGGFTPDYVFGHFEDADLCLKSIGAGRPPWLHDISLWHLEGKGSRRGAEHEGASAVNRWLFTREWEEIVDRDLLGPAPCHPAMEPA